MTIKIKLLKHVHYGIERLYPGCDLTRAICRITQKKTITVTDLSILIDEGGCDVNIEDVNERPQ